MKYHWDITEDTNRLLIKLEAQKIALDNTKSLPHLELALRKKSLLRSSVYSARIEGFADEETSPKKASQNLLVAYNAVHADEDGSLSIAVIKNLHRQVMKGMTSSAGVYRSEPWAIFDQSGNAVYLAPMHFEVPKLMEEYVSYISKLNEHPAVKAAVAQFIFEKIHPFADGNGRVGRLISAYILSKSGYGFRGLIPFEKYIESHRSGYYQSLESGQDVSQFIKYFLEALTGEIEEIIRSLSSGEERREDALLPRRREILNIISDHPYCTFDMIKRRFSAVNEKTLHYDLSQLIKKGFVQKIGVTRGVMYKKVDHS